ncbi:MAG: DUF4178 domain-containing protein [Myxococcales bacterium]|nr:DUF4178 domain-containing protein [Myxococcales bacterium]
MGVRQAPCPNCGGPIEIKLGSSYALVCPHCRFSVVRTDRDLQSIGKVSDLVPTSPELALGDRAYLGQAGNTEELVVGGRVQLDHGRGPWDEFYVSSTRTGVWGWLAKAQGRWYLTSPYALPAPVPAWQQLSAGAQGAFIPGIPTVWSVAEQGTSATLSAEGELPFPVRGGERGWYVDLEGPGGAFATIDYGDGSRAPTVYVGNVVAPDALRLDRAGGPRVVEKVDASRLRCPQCGAPVPLTVPEEAERAGCGHCGALLDWRQGNFEIVAAMEKARRAAWIPVGAEGTLFGEKLTCIGVMERSTWSHGEEFRWTEYLLHVDGQGGYRWLMEDNGHWTWLSPMSSGDVAVQMSRVRFAGKDYRIFSGQNVTVRSVVGEFYWKVEAGETTYTRDYIAPPLMVSEERGDNEVNWTAGRYVEPREIQKAFGLERTPPRSGVGFCQPNPHSVAKASLVAGLLLPLLCVLFIFFELAGDRPRVASLGLTVPPVAGEPTSPVISTSDPFRVDRGPTTLALDLRTNADNQYVGVEAALLEQTTGDVRHFFLETGYFRGHDGESWSEGSQSAVAYVDRVPPGTYVLQLQPMWEASPQRGGPNGLVPPAVAVDVRAHERSPMLFLIALGLLLLPFFWVLIRRGMFEAKRQENANG